MTWPEGLPGPKKITTNEQMTKALGLLDKIEAKYGLPFPGGDPRKTTGHNRDQSVTNTAPGVVQEEVAQ